METQILFVGHGWNVQRGTNRIAYLPRLFWSKEQIEAIEHIAGKIDELAQYEPAEESYAETLPQQLEPVYHRI